MQIRIFVTFVAIVTVAVVPVRGWTETIFYDDITCDTDNEYEQFIFNHDTYYVNWRGNKNPGCKVTFVPSDTNGLVCIETQNFNINECGVTVEYYSGYGIADYLAKDYGCLDGNPVTYCGEDFEEVSIKVNDGGDLPENPGSFDLKVYTRAQVNVGMIIGLSVGIPLLVIIITIIIVSVCCCVRRRRTKAGKGRVISPRSCYMGCPPYNGYQSIGGNNGYQPITGYQQGYVNTNYAATTVQPLTTCPNCNCQLPGYQPRGPPTNESATTNVTVEPENRT